MNHTIIAIDPGLKGAIAILTPSTITAEPLPLAGKALDLARLADMIRAVNPSIAVVEKVGSRPGQGVASTFKFGMGYGAIQGITAALSIHTELVTPQAWKRSVLAGTAKDKDAAIAYCRRAFPHVSLLPIPRSRTPHDGMADALCLAEFGRRAFSIKTAV